MLCVFDIETIPDIRQIAKAYNIEGKSPLEICQYAFNAQLEKSGSTFLPLYWHRVIAISSVVCDDYGKFAKVGSFGKSAIEALKYDEDSIDKLEQCLIEEFLQFLNTKEPRLVSFNGRGFDMPVLLLRAMRYNCSAFRFFEAHNHTRTKSKWENYRARYSEYWHTDLLDSLGSFGSTRALTLDGVCKMLGIVGKYDVSGGDVYELFYGQNAIDVINSYCQSDVLNTYWLYLKYAVLKGELGVGDYGVVLEDFASKLESSAPYAEVFKEQIACEIARLQGL